MPMRARNFGRLVLRSPTEMPSTVMAPFWNGSSPLTHLISVDLPEPDGPHTTTTSPLATLVEQSLSTWKVWYHLLTLLISIMAHAELQRMMAMRLCSRRTSWEAAKRDQEIDHGGEQVHLDQPPVALRDLRRRAQEVGDREHVDQRGVLEQDDGLRQQHRHHVAECLRQHDVAHGLRIGHAERLRGRDLAARDRLNAGAHDLGRNTPPRTA